MSGDPYIGCKCKTALEKTTQEIIRKNEIPILRTRYHKF